MHAASAWGRPVCADLCSRAQEESQEFVTRYGAPHSDQYSGRMGYSGFDVTLQRRGGAPRFVHVFEALAAEKFLLATGLRAGVLHAAVVAHVEQELARLASGAVPPFVRAPPASAAPVGASCTLPIVGPDNSTLYGPNTDDCGYYESHVTENNCYNYATNVVTDTFAQPGRGSGHKWDEDTCESVKAVRYLRQGAGSKKRADCYWCVACACCLRMVVVVGRRRCATA